MGIRWLRYLAARPDRSATLDQLARDVYNARPATLNRRRPTVRQQFNRTRDALEAARAPVRLTIDRNVVKMTAALDSRATSM
jgi:hypothetical protein